MQHESASPCVSAPYIGQIEGKIMANEALEKAVRLVANGAGIKEAATITGINADYLRHTCVKRGLYTPRFKCDSNRKEEAVHLIKAGYTAKQIVERLGYANTSAVHNLAHQHGLSVAKEETAKHDRIAALRMQGKSSAEIAKIVGMTSSGVMAVINQLGLKDVELRPEMETRQCALCGAEFDVPVYSNKRFCSEEHQRKFSRKPKREADDTIAKNVLAGFDDWEYIGGYTGSEGSAVVRHRCGYTTRKSMVTLRHNGDGCKCFLCEKRAKYERIARETDEAKRRKEVERFNRPVGKYKPVAAKVCEVCGGLYIGHGNTCGDDCRRHKMNHYNSMRKEKRRKNAMTDESKEINAMSLYRKEGGICWLCGTACDPEADPCADKYPSVDHIIPIANGGRDEWSNVHLAHRWCNSVRRNNQQIRQVIPYWVPPVE